MSKDSLDKGYEAQAVEQRWYSFWEKEGLFSAADTSDSPPYSLSYRPQT